MLIFNKDEVSMSYKLFEKHITTDKDKTTQAKNIVDRIYKSNHIDIGKYHLSSGSIFYIDPHEKSDLVKTYTVLSGQCMDLKTKCILNQGDLILIEDIDSLVSLYANEDTILLIHAQTPSSIETFELSADKMTRLLNELQQKDHYTKEHSDRVFSLVKRMALSLGYHSQALYNINKAARFHDIGKIHIDDAILNKPDRLTPDEFEVIKQHAHLGEAHILKAYSRDVYNIVLQHHERINGSGYPNGLKGDDICEAAKILAICDCYDAMTSQRVYSAAMSHEEAVSELRKYAGILYDKHLVDAFIKLFNTP